MYYICTLTMSNHLVEPETIGLTLSTPMPTHLPVECITDVITEELQQHIKDLARDFEKRCSGFSRPPKVIKWDVLVYDSLSRSVFLGGFTRASSVRPGCRWYRSVSTGPTSYRIQTHE